MVTFENSAPSQGPCSKHCMNGRCAKMNSFAYGSSALQQFSFPAVNNQNQNRSILLKNCIPSNLSRMCVSDMQQAHGMKKITKSVSIDGSIQFTKKTTEWK
ncbi:uncharacterized protein LOC142330587 [Lycorma delicatula]|uniref:uncharacterized protein LOC142330587 n=1 Tax=Lycorma delicatula TaxID=130591 RepID=UPI003F50DDEC